MSGGHFDYKQDYLATIADSIEDLIQKNGQTVNRDDYFESYSYTYPNYTEETILRFGQAVKLLREAYVYVQRIDWLVSCDDGEDDFHGRLKNELGSLKLLGEHKK